MDVVDLSFVAQVLGLIMSVMQPHNKSAPAGDDHSLRWREQVVKRANERLAHFPRYVRVRRAIVSAEPWTVGTGCSHRRSR